MKHIIKTTWGGCARPISAHAKRDIELSHFIHAECELSRHIYGTPKIFRHDPLKLTQAHDDLLRGVPRLLHMPSFPAGIELYPHAESD